ncbi:TonB-dependent receptor [Chitinivorax sp. B]|uniref:TonB-dependent receptor domain-containing protein n=1 Tax=Chitinivorax sp. B TaxID=2502235 RepID=UPI0010F44C2A|nr:TonB-dependent receptor [Chitinivorax sp. B]
MKHHQLAGLFTVTFSVTSFAVTSSTEPIVVTAARLPQPVAKALADISLISRDQIERSGASSVPELLRQLPGVEVSQNGGLGAISGVFLRGANSNQTVVLIDGVRVGSATSGGAALERLNLDQIERIEVLRGPSSSLYGADAIGGVIQLFTRKGTTASARILLGNEGLSELSAGLAGGSAATRANLNVSHVYTKGISATNDRIESGAFNPDRDGYRNLGLAAGVTHEWREGHDIAATLNASRGEVHYDGSYPDPADSDYRARQQLASAQLTSTNQLAAGWRSRVQVGQSKDRYENLYIAQNDLFETMQRQLTWQQDIDITGGVFSVVADHLCQEVTSNTRYDVSTRTVKGLAAMLQQRMGKLSWQASVRRDRNSQFGGHSTGGAALGYEFGEGWQARAAWAKAFKAPTFNDLYYPGFNNPNLKPENSRNAELALSYRKGVNRFGLTTYRNRVVDMIAIDPFTFDIGNIQRANLRGSTMELGTRIAGFELAGNVDWQQPKNIETGKLLPRRAKRHGSIRIASDMEGARWQVEWLASGERYDDVANTQRLAGYGLLNLGVDVPLARGVVLGARVNNVADKRYELARGYNQSGRGGFVSLSYQLK